MRVLIDTILHQSESVHVVLYWWTEPGPLSVNRGDPLQRREERPASSGRRSLTATCRHSAVAQEGQARLRRVVEQPSGNHGHRTGHGSTPRCHTQPKHGFRQYCCWRGRGKRNPKFFSWPLRHVNNTSCGGRDASTSSSFFVWNTAGALPSRKSCYEETRSGSTVPIFKCIESWCRNQSNSCWCLFVYGGDLLHVNRCFIKGRSAEGKSNKIYSSWFEEEDQSNWR